MLGALADGIWNPFFSLIYLELGILFLVVTGGFAVRYLLPVFFAMRKKGLLREADGDPINHSHGFFAALATSIGVGNMAGVATAIHLGGPGALFWMWVSAVLGVSFRMCSTYMALRYQPQDAKHPLFGTPLSYLDRFFQGPWRWIPTLFAGLVIVQGMVAANLIQTNSVAHAVESDLGLAHGLVALTLAVLVAMVIVGGLKNILTVSNILAPWMAGVYVVFAFGVLITHPDQAMSALEMVFEHAFVPYAMAGGVAGYTMLQAVHFGISRGVFSHGSGMGIAPFLHAANHDHPVRGAVIAGMIPIVDTLLVCSATGLVILSGGLWLEHTGAYLTVTSFQLYAGAWGRLLVTLFLVVFAFTTIINWSYFSERCFLYLGGRNTLAFRWVFVAISFCGPFLPVSTIWSLGDILIALMIIFHLLPLTYLVMRKQALLRQDLRVLVGSLLGKTQS
ncbi:amino acid carrier protein [Magnetococcus marinus MC-1]|uniref:Amino acid carrier protein n=1 Tax=Magnetococcus marinus (strain ATCC BAA-1437 / JCM 17883 / MC-1) TaxID=156889 RepID=A0L9Y0_MAGMM|nr:amino acid carrier protein [Magnetococcus marinus]ABK44773.1 amino acid carrier protein [Magnetococcus marinus MC-1]